MTVIPTLLQNRILLAVDGHDGVGKTTIATRLAKHLGAAYVRPYSGESGKEFIDAAEAGDYERAFQVAHSAVLGAIEAQHSDVIILDRCWATVFSILPWEVYSSEWRLWVPTAICWANLETTVARLRGRREKQYDSEYHRHYIAVYRTLAEKNNSLLVDTSVLDEDKAFQAALHWAEIIIKCAHTPRMLTPND